MQTFHLHIREFYLSVEMKLPTRDFKEKKKKARNKNYTKKFARDICVRCNLLNVTHVDTRVRIAEQRNDFHYGCCLALAMR